LEELEKRNAELINGTHELMGENDWLTERN